MQVKNKEFFIKIYNEYADELYRFIYFKVSNSEDALDISSTVFLKFWANLDSGKVKKDVKLVRYLIYRISRNCIIDFYRKSKKVEGLDDNTDEYLNLMDNKQDIHRDLELKSEVEAVRSNLEKLKDDYKEILLLKYVNELSINEIAKIINKSKTNTRVILHRALKALKNIS